MAPKRKAAPQGAEASSSGPQVPARALRKQTSDQEAAKALYDNFRTWSEEDLYVRTESGQTVFQAVKAAQKQKKKDPKFKMGQKFYDALRVRFRPHESAEAKLKLPDDCQLPVDQQLLAATAAFRKRRPDRQGLFIFVAACRKLNKAELVGVCRLALRLNVKDPKQLSGAVKILECFHRVQIRAEFPEQFTIMEGWIDGVLKALEKGSKFEDPEAFLAEYGDVCSLLIQPSDLQEVKDAAGDYKNCSAALGRIVVGSKVGAKLYGFAVLKILAEEVATHIERSFEVIHGIQKSKLHQLAALTGQAKVKMVASWVNRLMENRAPDFTTALTQNDAQVTAIMRKLPNFLSAQTENPDNPMEDKNVFGLEAAKVLLAAAAAKDKREEGDVAWLRGWSWLFDDQPSKDQAKQLLSGVQGAKPVDYSGAMEGGSSSSAPKATKQAGRKKKADVMSEAMSMFR